MADGVKRRPIVLGGQVVGSEAPTTAEVLFNGPDNRAVTIDQAFPESGERELAVLGMPAEARAARKAEARQMLDETEMNLGLGRTIIAEVEERRLSIARGHELDAAELVREGNDARAEVMRVYGHERGERLLTLAKTFVRAHPALAKMIDEATLGNRRAIVAGLVDEVRRQGLELPAKPTPAASPARRTALG